MEVLEGIFKRHPEIGDRPEKVLSKPPELVGNGPNTVSGSTVSNTELSEFFGAHWVPGSELGEFLSAYYLCAKQELTEFLAELTEFAVELSVSSLFWNSTLETVFRPFPKKVLSKP